jgi:BASS family bile acid:Na+ symporter
MPSPAAVVKESRGPLARFAHALHRYFLLVLLGVYALAAFAPGPGAYIREVAVTLPDGTKERVSMLLLAVLLFCAAAVIRWSQFRDVLDRPSILLTGLVASWLGPALLVIVASAILPRVAGGEATAGLLVGLALVAAMPVANSSAGWTQNSGGNVALCLGLVVLSILLSPLATPYLLKLMGLVLSGQDTARIEKVVTQFSGWRFILWVILPSLAGATAGWLAGYERIHRAKPWFRVITLSTILVLNYANASLAVDKIWARHEWRLVLVAAALAAAACLVGVALALVQARVYGVSPAARTALTFSLSMKHTGLALVLAGEILGDQPRVIVVILLTTLAQHVVAAAVDWRLQRAAVTA